MSALVPEFLQIYTGEDRLVPLRITNTDGTPFSLAGATEIEARFKKADGGVLSRKKNPIAEVTKFLFIQTGGFFDVIGAAKALQLYNGPLAGHYFWFNVTNGTNTQTDPVLVGTGHQVDILKLDSPAMIATKFYNAVALLVGVFTATNLNSAEVFVTNALAGDSPNATASGTAATITVTTAGQASAITVISDVLGRLELTLAAADTALFLVGERQSFSLIITLPTGIRKVNYRNALSVERQAV